MVIPTLTTRLRTTKKEPITMEHYFAQDGIYGDATDLVLVDTTNWTEDDWLLIEDAQDYERADLAQRISDERG